MKRCLLLLLPAIALSAQVVAPPATTIFDKDTVHEIRLTFAQADWYQQLTTNYDLHPDDTPYTEASLTWGQNTFDKIGVRFKGNSSYRGATTRKKPFRIKLNEFVKGQKIDGMASFGLSNAWNDPSFVREKPYYEVAAAAGLAAPRSNFAALYINGEYWGLYVLGEIVNSDFLKLHFAKGDDGGNLYKASDPGATLAYLGATATAYQSTFSKETNEDAGDWTDLIELARVFDQTPAADLPATLDQLIDVDSFLTALAIDNLTVNLDSYVGMAQNYYLYKRPSDQKWVWIPWDPSLAFGDLAQGLTVQQMKDLALEWVQSGNTGGPGGGGGGPAGGSGSATRPIASRLWQVAAYKQRYRQIYQTLVDSYLIPSQIIGRMNTMRDLIRPYVEKDTQKLVTLAQFEAAMTSDATTGGGAGPQGGAPALQPFIEGRVASVKAQLSGQTPLTISAAPAAVYFAQVAGTASTAFQVLTLSLSDATRTVTYSASAPSWITLSATGGSLPGTLRLTPNAGTLPAGMYSGTISITATGSSLSLPVSLTVVPVPGIVASPASLAFTAGAPGPGGQANANLTQTVVISSTAGASPFTAAVADATCNNFLSVSPASGTTPQSVTVTVNAANAAGACTARLNITAAGLGSAVVPVTFTGATGPGGTAVPTITSLVNSASFQAGPAAPGMLLTLFGTNIGPAALVNGALSDGKLATTAGGVQVTFDGTPAPLLYARINQVGVLVPFETAGKAQVTVQLSFNGRTSSSVPLPVNPTAPGIFTTAQNGTGQAAVINQGGAVNGANALATKGSTVSIYVAGAGQMVPAGTSGTLGLTGQSIVAPVTVSIGGQPATVTYAGAVPGSLQGVYQINAVVPEGIAGGSVPLQVTAGGAPAQSAVTMYVQ